MSSINQNVGNSPIDLAYLQVSGRPKWAIPWLENDPQLTAPELWVGRMLYEAADANWLGCTGLLGIHWRTKVIAPNMAALAAAAWDQSYVPAGFYAAWQSAADGAVGGTATSFTATVANTTKVAIYQTVSYGMSAYLLNASNGVYAVTLKFNEPYYSQAGIRVFGVTLQGQTVLTNFDIFALVGKNYALDYTWTNVVVTNGVLNIGFLPSLDYPCLAGIVISNGSSYLRKINCGGPATLGYEADPIYSIAGRDQSRSLSPLAFYTDFAQASFGSSVASAAGRILTGIDGMNLRSPATWSSGPGKIVVRQTPWAQYQTNYAFVAQFAALRPQVLGPGNLERFDYWLNMLRYLSAEAEVGCARGQLDAAITTMRTNATTQTKQQALTNRVALAQAWDRMMSYLLATVSTPGELGTVANLNQHSLIGGAFLTTYDAELATALGTALPSSVNLAPTNNGSARIIVPTVRTLAAFGESLTVKAILQTPAALSQPPVLNWRPLGGSNYQSAPMTLAGGAAYQASLPAATNDFEYQVTAQMAGTNQLVWPASGTPQTVVVWSPPARPLPRAGLSAAAGNGQVALNWNAIPGATGYSVKRATASGGFYPSLAATAGTNFIDATVANGTAYYYVVSATNADYESVNSAAVLATPLAALAVNAGGGAAGAFLADSYYSGGGGFHDGRD